MTAKIMCANAVAANAVGVGTFLDLSTTNIIIAIAINISVPGK